MVRRRLPLLLVVLLSLLAMSSNAAVAERVLPGGAPRPGSGPKDVPGFVRVIKGDTIEAWVDGQRTAIGIIGIEAPVANTDCGKQATAQLQALVKGGLRLEEDPHQTFDHRKRRMYHVKSRDGRDVAEELSKAGLVHATGKGVNKQRVADAEAEAGNAGRGCASRRTASANDDSGPVEAMDMLSLKAIDGAPVAASALQAGAAPTISVAAVAAAPTAATVLPGGFTQDIVATGGTGGLVLPTAMAFLPDGRILIAQQNGTVRVVKNGALLVTPFIDLQDRVNDYWDRGLLGIAVDPAFATNGHVYLLYVYEDNAADYEGKKTSRLVRYTAPLVNGLPADTASVSSETVLLGSQVGPRANGGLSTGCLSLPTSADCIPAEGASHSAGNVKFAPDETLFLTTGDASSFTDVDDNALRAQNVNVFAGKLIRVSPTGAGVPSNPFWNGDPNATRSKVWATGLRNPYRFNLRPGTSIPYVGDVGWNSVEEINVAKAGANLGWPCYEGPGQQFGYASKPVCNSLYGAGASAVVEPLISWGHNFGGTCCSSAATGGAFYTGTAYPGQYQGAYFYTDYGKSWIRYLRVDANDKIVPGSDAELASAADGPVDLEMGPDGNLYYLSIETNQLRRIRYTGGSNQAPTAAPLANPSAGLTPLSVQFTGAGSTDPNGDPLTYSWSFGDGSSTSAQVSPQHTYATNGTYTASLTVSDGRGGTDTKTVVITAGNAPPVATITAPSSSLQYKVNDVVAYSGSATDHETGTVPDSGLVWQVIIRHCPGGQCHQHVLKTTTGPSGSFPVPDHGDDSHFEVRLTATDDAGLTDMEQVTLRPQTVQVTLASTPTGLNLLYDGASGQAPQVKTTVPGSTHTIEAPHQVSHQFSSWSDGGAQQHEITAGASNATYTATFVQLPTVTFDDKAGQNQPLNGQYPTGVIDWGTGNWYHSGPWGALTTKSVSFNAGGVTSAPFTFVTPRRLVSLRAYNGGSATTVTLSCAGQPAKTQALGAGALVTIETGWTGACTTVTVGSTNGWDTNFDDITHDAGGTPPSDTTPPMVSSRSPASGATNVAMDANVTATFSEDVTGVSGSTFQLKDASSAEVPATVTYSSSTRTATLNPTASLANGASYTVTLTGGTGAIRDQAGNPLTNDTWSFTVVAAPPPDTTPPVISAVQSTAVTSTGATITWTTDEASDTQVEYGPTTGYGSSTALDTAMITSHSQVLSGLTASTLYHYRVKSKDADGNLATSGDFTFTTVAPSTSQTITFDDRAGQDQALNGQYPAGVVDWGNNKWHLSGPRGTLTTKSVSFDSGRVTSQTFKFVTARKLVSLKAYNAGGAATIVTISCNKQTKSQSVPAGQAMVITTGFSATCTMVTLASTNGWDTNFDDIVHSPS